MPLILMRGENTTLALLVPGGEGAADEEVDDVAVKIGGDVLAGAGEERDKAVVEDEFPEFAAAGDFIDMREDDMRGAERAGAGVGVLDELALVGGVHDEHTGGDVEFVEGFLQVPHGFSGEDHSGHIEVDDGFLGDFAEFVAGAEERDAEGFAAHGEFLGGVRLVGFELHHEGLPAAEEDIGGELLAEGIGGAGAGRAEKGDAVREGEGTAGRAVAHEEREVGDGGLGGGVR